MQTSEKCRAFRRLHERGCFVMPNPWDVGSTRYLQSLGFQALATTSSGAAFAMGHADGGVPRSKMLAHIAEIVSATHLPVNADFEGGHSDEPAELADAVRLCVLTGVAGLSIEDYTNDMSRPLYELPLAVERVRAAREAIDTSGGEVVLTGRAEGLIRGVRDLDGMIRRLVAYSEAGADCLYAPGLTTAEQIKQVVDAVAPKPVNVLVATPTPLTVADLAALGVRRISVGSGLARAAWGAFMRAARLISQQGSFAGYEGAASGAELNALFRTPSDRPA